jgi:hypothetical protein
VTAHAKTPVRKWVVFLSWVWFTYLFAVITAMAVPSTLERRVATLADPRFHLALLAASIFVAIVSCLAIWSIPTQRRAILVPIGIAIGLGAVVLMTGLLITFFGGFEANMAWFSLASAIVLPSLISGGIAGYCKSLDLPIAAAPPDTAKV